MQLKQILFFERCSRNQQGIQKDSTTRSSSDETLSDSCHVQEEHTWESSTRMLTPWSADKTVPLREACHVLKKKRNHLRNYQCKWTVPSPPTARAHSLPFCKRAEVSTWPPCVFGLMKFEYNILQSWWFELGELLRRSACLLCYHLVQTIWPLFTDEAAAYRNRRGCFV